MQLDINSDRSITKLDALIGRLLLCVKIIILG